MLITGLTGNYGTGKSSVLSMFKRLGAATVDADRIVGNLLKQKAILDKIKTLFGPTVFEASGRLDRQKLAAGIFRSRDMRTALEDILHPLVFERIDRYLKGIKGKHRVFIVEAALIFERGYEDRFDRTIAVYTDKKNLMERLRRKGVDARAAGRRLRCQLPIETKVRKADFKINNSGSRDETGLQVEAIYKRLSEESKARELVLKGRLQEAAGLLGTSYYVEGSVIKGAGRGGRLLHTPTANLSIKKRTCLREGVYAVRVSIIRGRSSRLRELAAGLYNGVANIGRNPTFGQCEPGLEVHIFDFSGNLLGKKLRVYFVSRLRAEKKFRDIKALEAQIRKDIKKAKEILGSNG